MNAIVVEQRPVTATDPWDFQKKMRDAMDEGWRIVPGSVAIAIASNENTPDERYFAVLEK
jgi:hypothetical protein